MLTRPPKIVYELCQGETVKIRLKETDPWIEGVIDSIDKERFQIFVRAENANWQFHYNEYSYLIARPAHAK